LESVAEMAIRKAREHVAGRDNLSWGKFVQAAATRRPLDQMRKAAIGESPAYSPEGGERPDRPGAEERVVHEV
jgi:hypothetical protein